ncbi:metallophosphoesterase family protein [Ramlibacter sp.]|uniref:metallophosphoesterase family protein n=1 Tax=Ramlibacter sp. TaxID=1917967 RepID=UPI003D0D42B3
MKLLHTADWQIGRVYSQFDSGDGAQLSAARVDAVARIAELAVRHEVDAVVVAGDVFDSQAPREKAVVRLFEAMRGFAGPWVLLPGNHDAALAESVWTLARRLNAVPANVHLGLTPETLHVAGAAGAKIAVLPAPLTQRHTHLDLTAWFDDAQTDADAFRIGVAHGSVEGWLPEAADAQNPIAADRAQRARLDYLALGDWHGKLQVNERTWYSGTPEPERFRANDPGFALLVEIASPGATPNVTPVSVGRYRWVTLSLDVGDARDAQRAVDALAGVDSSTVAEVHLTGSCDLAWQERLQSALAAAENKAAALAVRVNDLRLAPTEADLRSLQADGFLGEVLDTLKVQLASTGDEAETARDALLHLARIQRELGAVPSETAP